MSPRAFCGHYWWKDELVEFARRLGLSTLGDKPVLAARIERCLRGRPETREARTSDGPERRDSARVLRRSTPVVHYSNDSKTRAFFQAQIGPQFHFTRHLTLFRRARADLTYGDLVDEWLAEYDRRRTPGYVARIEEHGQYNRFVRDFFADERNAGKSLSTAAAAWNAAKLRPGVPRYRASRRTRRKP